jgi:hypothetical protein
MMMAQRLPRHDPATPDTGCLLLLLVLGVWGEGMAGMGRTVTPPTLATLHPRHHTNLAIQQSTNAKQKAIHLTLASLSCSAAAFPSQLPLLLLPQFLLLSSGSYSSTTTVAAQQNDTTASRLIEWQPKRPVSH